MTLNIDLYSCFTIGDLFQGIFCSAPLSEKGYTERLSKWGFCSCDVIPEAHLFSDRSLIIGNHLVRGRNSSIHKHISCPFGDALLIGLLFEVLWALQLPLTSTWMLLEVRMSPAKAHVIPPAASTFWWICQWLYGCKGRNVPRMVISPLGC